MTSYAIEALPDPATKRRDTLFSRLLSPAPEFDLSCIGEGNRPEVEVFVKQKFKQSYSADINEFFPDLLCMRCFGKRTGTAGMRVANDSKLFLEQYLDQAIETELSELNNKSVSRESIVEIGNLASSQRGASHLLFLLFTSILHGAGYRWIAFTATKSLQNNLNKLGFELSYLCDADPSKLDSDSVEDWGRYYDTEQYANNRSELSHQPTRVRERGMRKFKSVVQAQRFLNTHAAVYNLFNLGRHLVSAENYRYFRLRAFASWENAVAI